MTMRVRVILMLIVAAMMGMAGCDHYVCSAGASFGSGCTSTGGGVSGGGGSGGGGGAGGGLALAYYVNNSQVGSVELDSTGLLYTPNFVLPTLPATYTSAGAVIAAQKFLYVPYASSGQLFGWSIDGTTGTLTSLTGSPFTASYAAGIVQASQASFPIITNPAGTLLFVADTVNSQVDVLQIDPTSGRPTAVPGSPFTTVIPPWNLATDGLGKYLYVTEGNSSGSGEGGLQMAVYTIDPSTGALSAGTSMAFDMWEVQGEPTGKFMIGVTGRTGKTGNNDPVDPNVYVFNINLGGVLTQVAGSPFPTVSGNGPIGVVVHPNGQFVYDFNVSTSTSLDSAVEGYQLNTSTGALTSLGAPFSSLTTPYTGFFDQSGAYLFIHAAGSIGVFNVDPTTGIPTEPTQPLGVGSGAVVYPWVVTDPL